MTTLPSLPGFDGLIKLSRREGVDIRPTLLRVLTDLYVQANAHSGDEARQFVELTSRLIDEVDDATRAAVRARLAIYPGTPVEVLKRLVLRRSNPDQDAPLDSQIPSPTPPAEPPSAAQLRLSSSNLSMQPNDAAEISDMFFRANASERALILHNFLETPLKASARIPAPRAARAIETLEMAACAVKALDMPSPVFQRVLLFLNPEYGCSVNYVYRVSRLYDHLHERSALIMLAAWRGSAMAVTRARYRPGLYDAERQRARQAPAQTRPAVQLPGAGGVMRTGSKG